MTKSQLTNNILTEDEQSILKRSGNKYKLKFLENHMFNIDIFPLVSPPNSFTVCTETKITTLATS